MMENNGSISPPGKRSVGVSVVGFLLILGGLLYGFLLSIFPFGEGVFVPEGWTLGRTILRMHLSKGVILEDRLRTFASVMIILLPLISVAMGISILKYKPWSRKWVICISMIYILVIGYCLKTLVKFRDALTPLGFSFLVPLLLCSFLIYFFTRPKVKAQFEKDVRKKEDVVVERDLKIIEKEYIEKEYEKELLAEGLVVIREFSIKAEAGIAKGNLDEEGIEAVVAVRPDNLPSDLPAAKLLVHKNDVEKAEEILKALEI